MAVASVPSLWVRRVKEIPSFSIRSILNMKHVGTGGPLTWFKPGDLSSHSFPFDFVI
jgi:hypothetical protein